MKFSKIIFFIFFSFLGSYSYALDANGNFESKQERDEILMILFKKLAKELNEQTPILLDEETKMMSVMALYKTITINMTLVNYASDHVNPHILQEYAKENINYNVCQSQATKMLIDAGFKYTYIYTGNDGRIITRVVVDSYNC
ncbi:type II secretion system pilot lipoprotein GspS-beta [Acinetobacter baumannii]|uniref:type II secretion system pilot lipoprotein GspS-beta n=1 Tax=Acinetobacter baumannii TaxID=470 RepID=UPI003AF59F68